MTSSIGLVGAGRMGRGLARNLIRHGRSLLAHDPSATALADVASLGAGAATSAAEVAAKADVVITCLPDVATVERVYDEVIPAARRGALFIEMTSSSPRVTRAIAAKARARGAAIVDAPILKGVPEAWEGTSHILLAGDAADRSRARRVLELVSERVIEVGELGSAHALKAVNNAVTMANAAILAEAFQTARRLGVSAELFIDVLRGGLPNSRMLELYAPRLASGEHPRTGSIAFGEKDLGLFLEVAGEAGTFTPVAEGAHRLYQAMCGFGFEQEAPSMLADLLERYSDSLRRAT